MPSRNGGIARSLCLAIAGLVLAVALPLLKPGPVDAAAPVDTSEEPATDWTGRTLDPAKSPFAAGAAIYKRRCAACHDSGGGRTPQVMLLRDMTPRAIYRALTEGAMRGQGAGLSNDQKVSVSEFLAGRKLVAEENAPAMKMCSGKHARFDFDRPPAFAHWGVDKAGTHFIDGKTAGLNRDNVGKLKLKWAFGVPDSQRMRSQPALAGGAIILGNHTGAVYALDEESGCVRWSFDAEAEVRTGVVVGPWEAGDRQARPLAYFGDVRGNVYAVRADTGELAWKVAADSHPAAVITAAPSLHDGTLYVPVSSIEEAAAASPGYACCTFRGSVLALDAETGAQSWRTYLVGEAKAPGDGEDMWGPSGVAVWNSPVIDPGRGQLYFATGDNYSTPATELSDSIVALDLETGEIKWHYQALEGDAWNVACYVGTGNCPEDAGPDFDFGAGTVLATGKDGRELVMAGQKSGIAYAVDPDTGELVWKTRVGRGSEGGGILFGLAAAEGRLFVPVTDPVMPGDDGFPSSPGLYALDIASGEFVWKAPSADTCEGKKGCSPGYSGSVTATPELVLAGSNDGWIRIYDAATGEVLWEMDADREFETVNRLPARGGSVGGGVAPIAYKGKLIVPSGYGFASKMPGNVLLVFSAD
ncbi:MAG: PQQ-binding-like beta-propeller repeat protein [Novosphingobium sp.]|nr:PQQ-binding-like beta-propeller repeat protein [Novosphingobium sp.]MCP5401486.1 PQQ-binding-like beta-propeller repeat protein [Novosphingobium sp.]